MGKHTGSRNVLAENLAYVIAELGHPDPLRGRHHKTCAPAIVKAHYNRWLNSTERQYTRKEDTWSGLRSTTPSPSTPRS